MDRGIPQGEMQHTDYSRVPSGGLKSEDDSSSAGLPSVQAVVLVDEVDADDLAGAPRNPDAVR